LASDWLAHHAAGDKVRCPTDRVLIHVLPGHPGFIARLDRAIQLDGRGLLHRLVKPGNDSGGQDNRIEKCSDWLEFDVIPLESYTTVLVR
jgi:hypothetical protein